MTDEAARYHTFWPRVAAAIIDGIVLLPVALATNSEFYSIESAALIILLEGTNYSVPIAYSVILHARYGQTIGKSAVGVRVMDVGESRLPSVRQAILRDVGEIAPNLALFLLASLVAVGLYPKTEMVESPFWVVFLWAGLAWTVLELVTMLTNRKRRAVHDYIGGTVVVRVPRN